MKENIENYRPISLTCISAKVMERIIYDELFSRTHHLIDSRQNGFLKNNSCAMHLTTQIESLSTNLLQDLPTDIIYFDFAKAFDTVNHDLILSKLKYQYSIDGRMLKFFKSYLSNRTQRVVLDNCTLDIVDVLSGVLQGSILAPLLFVLFINDICTIRDVDCCAHKKSFNTAIPVRSLGPYMRVHYCTYIVHILV